MKNLKAKLIASVAMLLVSTIMLTSASFAWFTISTAPEISGMTTTVVTNETLEIALDKGYKNEAAVDAAATNGSLSGDYYTWGNLVNLAAEEGKTNTAYDAYKNLNKTLRPATLSKTTSGEGAAATVTATAFKAPNYGPDGRISDLNKALSTKNAAETANGFGLLIDAGKADTTTDDVVYGYYIDYWMRSNVGGQVVLSAAADRDGSGDATTGENIHETVGGGSTFKATNTTDTTAVNNANKTLAANIRVAFQKITPAAGDENGARVTTGIIADATTAPVTGAEETATFTGNVINLTPNKAELVRVYIYLEGANVKNSDASIDTAIIGGDLNLQFTIAEVKNDKGEITTNGVNTSMLTPPAQ